MQKLLLTLAAVGFVSAMAPMAHADTDTQFLSVNNPYADKLTCSPACSGPYASLSVNLMTATTATITVTGLSDSNYQYLIGDDSQAMAFDVNASTFTATNFTATQLPGFTSTGYVGVDTGQTGYDTSGNFNLAIYSSPSETNFNSAAEEISFLLTDTSGTWASANDVLTPNAFHFDAALETYVCPVSACTTTSEVTHGVVDVTPTPEPGSLALLGTGVLGLSGIVRRKFRR